MDRPYSSRQRKSQRRITINSEASEKLKPQQSDKRLVSPFADNVVKEIGDATKQKESVSKITEASCDSTCAGVNSLPKIEADDNRSDTNLTTTTTSDKKCSLPSIKAPLLPTTRIQVPPRIQSAAVRRLPLVKVDSTATLLAVRPRPIGGDEKPNSIWHSGKPIAVNRSTSALDGTEAKEQTSASSSTVSQEEELTATNEVKKFEEIPTMCDVEQTSSDTSIASEELRSPSLDETAKTFKIPSTLGDAEAKEQTSTNNSTAKEPHTSASMNRPTTEEEYEELCHNLAAQYSYTPLKMIVDELLLLHHDVLPSQICPMLNRSPSIIGDCSDSGGLLSGSSSPKLDIPRRRYCGRMIQQHPLDKHIHRMKKPIRQFRDVYKSIPSSDSSSAGEDNGGSHHVVEVYTPDQLVAKFGHNIKTEEGDVSLIKKEYEGAMSKENSYLKLYTEKKSHKEAVQQPSSFLKLTTATSYLEMYNKKLTTPKSSLTRGSQYSVLPPIEQPTQFLKPTSYLEMYKKKEAYNPLPTSKFTRGNQYSVLPPIGVTAERHPTPPSDKPAMSTQLGAARKFRVKQLQKKKLHLLQKQ